MKDSFFQALESPDDGLWRDHANCRTLGTTDFFITASSNSRAVNKKISEVVALCDACSVRGECLRFAIDNNIIYGIWGGMTATQRKRYLTEVSVMVQRSEFM